MRQSRLRCLALACLLLSCIDVASAQNARLRVLSISAWDGYDHSGGIVDGRWQDAPTREELERAMVASIGAVDPDVVFLQNASPRLAARLSGELGFDRIHQMTDGGVRLGPIGFPFDRARGLAILARPELHLQSLDVWKLSGPFGLHGGAINVQGSPASLAIAATIRVDSVEICLVNTVLNQTPPRDTTLIEELAGFRERGTVSRSEFDRAVERWDRARACRRSEIDRLVGRIRRLPAGAPLVLGGSLGATADSPELATLLDSMGMIDAGAHCPATWDPVFNAYARWSGRPVDASGDTLDSYDLLVSLWSRRTHRSDYLLLGHGFDSASVIDAYAALIDSVDGVLPSDHNGVLADLDMRRACAGAPTVCDAVEPPVRPIYETIPLTAFAPSAGYGYGFRSILVGASGDAESFDLTIYRSTGGEEYHQFTVSWPDRELRHGLAYDVGLDVHAGYRREVAGAEFTAADPGSVRETAVVSATVSTGVTSRVVAAATLRYRGVSDDGPTSAASGSSEVQAAADRSATVASIIGTIRVDTRDSRIEPHRGSLLAIETELAPQTGLATGHFGRFALDVRHYSTLCYPTTTLALAARLEAIVADRLPAALLPGFGGRDPLQLGVRGPYERPVIAEMEAEARIPVVWRFGLVVGLGASGGWDRIEQLSQFDWRLSPVVAIRYAGERLAARLNISIDGSRFGARLALEQPLW